MRIGRTFAAATLALALLGAGGCSDDDSPGDGSPSSPASTSSSSPSPTESSTPDQPTEPEWPAAADGTGDKAARAFAKYWLAMVNYAQSTGDVAPLEGLHTPHCSACKSGVARVKQAWHGGKSLVGGTYRLVRHFSIDSPEEIVHIVELRTNYSQQKRVDGDGKVLRKTGEGDAAFRLYLKIQDGSWVVAALEVQQ